MPASRRIVAVRADGLLGAALLLLIAVIYHGALRAGFQFDDFDAIVNYAPVHSWQAWRDSLPAPRPLLNLSYTANWVWFGAQPFGFHLFNLICHGAGALLAFGLGRQLFRAQPERALVALIAAAMFALHPAQSEAVTYISGRAVSLMAPFYLAALLAAGSSRRSLQFALAPPLFALALLANESAWTLPLALLLLNTARGFGWRENALRALPLLLVAVAAAVLFERTPAYPQWVAHSLSIRPLAENLALQIDGWFYLMTRPLLLLQTNIDPDLPAQPLYSSYWWLRLLVVAIVMVAALRWRRHLFGIGLLWFLLHLLPGTLLPRDAIASDRQLYLALLGPAWVLAGALAATLPPRLMTPFAVLLLLSLGAATLARNRDYRDEIHLWQATAQRSPNKARVWNNLGYAYQLAGLRAPAQAAYRQALRIDPALQRARFNLQLLEAEVFERAQPSVVPAQ